MDWLIEKATELGVTSIQPLLTERSVLRLQGERAEKKVAHWQSVAIAACEQCGGNRVPLVHPVLALAPWLKTHRADTPAKVMRLLLSLNESARPLRSLDKDGLQVDITFLSGPEGGLSAAEENAATASGYEAVTLGPRVLRSETAALVALAGLLL
jgi:16S rRNA (uracil1498-N3)-methyltransferase